MVGMWSVIVIMVFGLILWYSLIFLFLYSSFYQFPRKIETSFEPIYAEQNLYIWTLGPEITKIMLNLTEH